MNKAAQELGRIGGKSGTGAVKARSSDQARNAVDQRWKPHFQKVAYFESVFSNPLIANEWRVKWPVEGCKSKTYNPDYECPELNCFVECVTSGPNIAEQSAKWKAAIESGRPLRVFWWQGQEITHDFHYGYELANTWKQSGGVIPRPVKQAKPAQEWVVYCIDGRGVLKGPRTAQDVKKTGYGFTAISAEYWKFPNEKQAANKARVVNKHIGWASLGIDNMAHRPA